MIVAHALDLPKIEPDDWNIFRYIWKNYAKPLVKIGYNEKAQYKSDVPVGSTNCWIGMDLFKDSSCHPHWIAPTVNISNFLPKMYSSIMSLDIQRVALVRLVQSTKNHGAHSDTGNNIWEVRYMFSCSDPAKHWYYTPYGDKNNKVSLLLPIDNKWFTYNDSMCHHGTNYFSDDPKILLQVLYYGNLSTELRQRGIDKYPECVIEF